MESSPAAVRGRVCSEPSCSPAAAPEGSDAAADARRHATEVTRPRACSSATNFPSCPCASAGTKAILPRASDSLIKPMMNSLSRFGHRDRSLNCCRVLDQVCMASEEERILLCWPS